MRKTAEDFQPGDHVLYQKNGIDGTTRRKIEPARVCATIFDIDEYILIELANPHRVRHATIDEIMTPEESTMIEAIDNALLGTW